MKKNTIEFNRKVVHKDIIELTRDGEVSKWSDRIANLVGKISGFRNERINTNLQ